MRKRDTRAGWQQILALMGVGSIPEEEWEDICKDYQRSWSRLHYIDLGNKAIVGAVPRKGRGPSPVMKHRNSGAVASSHVKRRKTSPSPSPSTPVASPLKRRNSMAPPSTPTPRPFSKGQAWDSSFCTPQSLKDFKNFKPFTPISPIESLDSVALDQEMNLKKSGSSVPPSARKRRNSSVSASASAKVKSKQKPISIVKHVTGSGDELDDEQMLVTWKDYGKQQRALKKKETPPKKRPGDIGVDPPVKRKKGRPTREEKATRLEEEQALKMMNQTSNPSKLPPKMQSNPVGTKPAQEVYDERKELDKIKSILNNNLGTRPRKQLLNLFLIKPVLMYNKKIAKLNQN